MLKSTVLRCSQTTAFVIFLLLGTIFVLSGCHAIYKTIGLTDAQADAQVVKDQATIQTISNTMRSHTTEVLSQIIAGAGAILSGFLARWLGTERKITKALITGIESNNESSVKNSVQTKAIAAGIETKLHRRVEALT